jgi:S-adenosylmethionine-dependent methyltransferase
VVWDACRQELGDVADRTVLDIGGGTGGFAVRVAELGHRVTVIDPSPDALAALERRAAESGVGDRVIGQQGELASLGALVEPGTVDLVLCHDVLGLVDDSAGSLSSIRDTLRPGGVLSLVVGQRHAAVLARAMAGHFDQALEALDGESGPERRFTAAEISEKVEGAGFTVTSVQAVRVFADLVPSTILDLEPGALSGLLDLERAVAARPEYYALGSQLHVLAKA